MSAQTALVNFDAEFARIAEETRACLAPASGNNSISTKAKLFTFPDGRTAISFTAIIVNFIRANLLYPPYNPNVHADPKCWAIGFNDASLAPSEKVPRAQSDLCKPCAMNQYGSATNGGKGKACTNTYRLAIVPPTATNVSDIWTLKVPPTSMARWKSYSDLAEATYGPGGVCRITTEISFDPNKDYPSLIFKALDDINNPEAVLSLRARATELLRRDPTND